MAQIAYPLNNSPILTTAEWAKLAMIWLSSGVIKSSFNELQVVADSSGMNIKVKSGAAFIKGCYYENDAEATLAIGASNSTNPRIDRIIVRLDWVENTVALAVLQGTPAVTPSAPALTQNTARWEIPLAQVRVDAAVVTIASNKVTDERYMVKATNAYQENWINAVMQNSWITEGGRPARYYKNDFGQVHIEGTITGGVSSNGITLFTLPAGYRPQTELHCIVPVYNTELVYSNVEIIINPNGNVTMENGLYQAYVHLFLPPFRAYQ